MAVPYMGSKRKSAGKIYRLISQREPKGTIVDLFCGGLAVGEKFLENGWQVIANDKNKYVVALLDQTINKGLDETIVTEWVSRERFFQVINNPDEYEDWYVGYIQCVWSFGNNQKDYLFGKETEPIKKAGHELVIDKDQTEIKKLIPTLPQRFIDGVLKQKDWHTRRLALKRVSKALKTRVLELEQLQQLQQLERLERLEQLEQLQQLQQLERLELYAMDYNKVTIPKEAVVYCDPPYKGTVEYSEGDFNHDEFWQWCREIPNTVYISEYNAPEDFVCIRSFPQKSTLQGGQQKHTNQPDEKIFVRKVKK